MLSGNARSTSEAGARGGPPGRGGAVRRRRTGFSVVKPKVAPVLKLRFAGTDWRRSKTPPLPQVPGAFNTYQRDGKVPGALCSKQAPFWGQTVWWRVTDVTGPTGVSGGGRETEMGHGGDPTWVRHLLGWNQPSELARGLGGPESGGGSGPGRPPPHQAPPRQAPPRRPQATCRARAHQPVLNSTWASKKPTTGAVAAFQPCSRARIRPSRRLLRTIFTRPGYLLWTYWSRLNLSSTGQGTRRRLSPPAPREGPRSRRDS